MNVSNKLLVMMFASCMLVQNAQPMPTKKRSGSMPASTGSQTTQAAAMESADDLDYGIRGVSGVSATLIELNKIRPGKGTSIQTQINAASKAGEPLDAAAIRALVNAALESK